MVRFAPLYEVQIDDATADVRATFYNTEKYGVDDAPASFESVEIRLTIDSPASDDAVAKLVEHAERACHMAQSLRHPVPVAMKASHNAEPIG